MPHDASLILIVDDDPIMRKLLRRAMEQDGHQAIEAANGLEAISLYQQHAPELVLLDAVMPEMDGFECCQRLQALVRQKTDRWLGDRPSEWNSPSATVRAVLASVEQLPVLMITGLDDSESVEQAFAVGALDYVTKPLEWVVLRHRVRRCLERSRLYRQLVAANRELERLASRDALTQIPNRRSFDRDLEFYWNLLAREQKPLALILCDIDYFKRYNDTYGHQAGDRCLQQVAAVVSGCLQRETDRLARYGGEEMAAILPHTDRDGGLKVAERIRVQLLHRQISHRASPVSDYVTLSLGVGCMVPKPFPQGSPSQAIALADRALYLAKETGRNRAIALNEGESPDAWQSGVTGDRPTRTPEKSD